MKFSVGVEGVAPSGKNFVSVGLMSHIPHDAVGRCIEDVVQGYSEFHDPKA